MNGRKPRVSIGLPVYNGELFIKETLDSLLDQTYGDFELIISDNASTDGTEDICRKYAAKDPRVQYNRNEHNFGVGYNFNRVFNLSRGEYFKWASADDLCKPELLARCLEVLDGDPSVVLAYAKTRFVDEKGQILNISDPGWDIQSEAAYERLLYVIRAGHWVNCHYGLIRSGALAKTRLLPTYPGGDYRLLAELSLAGKFFEIDECLFLRRVHSGASSQNTTKLEWVMEFHTGNANRVCLPLWSLFFDFLTLIMKSPFSLREKLTLVDSIVHRMWWGHNRLFQELIIIFFPYRNRLPIRNIKQPMQHGYQAKKNADVK